MIYDVTNDYMSKVYSSFFPIMQIDSLLGDTIWQLIFRTRSICLFVFSLFLLELPETSLFPIYVQYMFWMILIQCQLANWVRLLVSLLSSNKYFELII